MCSSGKLGGRKSSLNRHDILWPLIDGYYKPQGASLVTAMTRNRHNVEYDYSEVAQPCSLCYVNTSENRDSVLTGSQQLDWDGPRPLQR